MVGQKKLVYIGRRLIMFMPRIIGIVLRPLGRMLIVQRQGSIPVLLIACIPWVVASLATAAGWCCMPFPGAAFSHLPHILSSLMMPLYEASDALSR
jgi:hypothetical protein